MPVALEVKNVTKDFPLASGRAVTALKDISFSAKQGEFVSIIGPSGCGKSTLIRLLAGLALPTAGQVLEQGAPISAGAQSHGVMFQQYSLFPWLTVAENINLGLRLHRTPPAKRAEITAHYIQVMGLAGFERAYPKELSGGMQQRVALARALATNPSVLLMDEPFAALDVQTKRFMQDLLLQVWAQERKTIVFVTHDVEEAVFLSDAVYLMTARPGRIRERIPIPLPRPRDLRTEFSLAFIRLKKRIQKTITKEALPLAKLDLAIYKGL